MSLILRSPELVKAAAHEEQVKPWGAWSEQESGLTQRPGDLALEHSRRCSAIQGTYPFGWRGLETSPGLTHGTCSINVCVIKGTVLGNQLASRVGGGREETAFPSGTDKEGGFIHLFSLPLETSLK